MAGKSPSRSSIVRGCRELSTYRSVPLEADPIHQSWYQKISNYVVTQPAHPPCLPMWEGESDEKRKPSNCCYHSIPKLGLTPLLGIWAYQTIERSRRWRGTFCSRPSILNRCKNTSVFAVTAAKGLPRLVRFVMN
jgi:hypothetical protein